MHHYETIYQIVTLITNHLHASRANIFDSYGEKACATKLIGDGGI